MTSIAEETRQVASTGEKAKRKARVRAEGAPVAPAKAKSGKKAKAARKAPKSPKKADCALIGPINVAHLPGMRISKLIAS